MIKAVRKWSSNYLSKRSSKTALNWRIFRWSVWIFKARSSRHATHDKARS
jgi:hypothetical protein